MIEIREESPEDIPAVHSVNEAAFARPAEAHLVDKLRAACDDYVSFVAVDSGVVVGHILFTPITLDSNGLVGMGLAPLAVLPSHQRQGIGSRLVRRGLAYLRPSGCPFVIVLGHSHYYPRFGFERASVYGLISQWDGVPDEAFMVIVFNKDAMPREGSVARYRAEFDEAM